LLLRFGSSLVLKHTLASLDKAFASEIAVRQDHILTQGFPQRYKTSFKSKTLFQLQLEHKLPLASTA
jgi:hypothetical protein